MRFERNKGHWHRGVFIYLHPNRLSRPRFVKDIMKFASSLTNGAFTSKWDGITSKWDGINDDKNEFKK